MLRFPNSVFEKRKNIGKPKIVINLSTNSEKSESESNGDSNPVSYTHLDVYKRQVVPSMS